MTAASEKERILILARARLRLKQQRSGPAGAVTGFMANVNRGSGIGDELAAAGGVVTGLFTGRHKLTDNAVEAYRRELGYQRGAEDQYATSNPNWAAVARGTGMAGVSALPTGQTLNLFTQGGRAVNAARGATLAAGQGAAYAAADRGTAQERLTAASRAARDPVAIVVGATGGALVPAAKPKPKSAPTRQQLTDMRKTAYADVKASGQTYTPEEFAGVVQTIKRDLADADFDADFDPAVATMVRKLDEKVEAGFAPTIGEVDRVRQAISKNVARRGDGNQRRLGSQMIRSLDESLEETGGDGLLRNARDLYMREQKVRATETALAKSRRNSRKSGSGANGDNAIRQRMDRLIETVPGLKPDELAALEDIVLGDPVRNTLRSYGQTSPIAGGLSAMLNAGAGLGSGGTTFWAHSVPSTAAKIAADRMAKAKARELIQLMAAGGTREQLIAIQRQAADLPGPAGSAIRRMVAARLSGAAGVQAGAAASEAQPNYFARP